MSGPSWDDPGELGRAATGSVLTVSELVMKASTALEAEFGTVAVEGEISSFRHVERSGHMYWTLKDAASQVECAMFRSDNRRLKFPIVDGEQVVVVGRPTIYRVRGRFQMVVSDVLSKGRGALWMEFERLKEKLTAEGLFAEDRKRPLPFWPRVIGVVTSGEGAAVKDICTVIRRRAPATKVWIKPVPVQGREAAPEVSRAIRWFAGRAEVELLIVGRGGGSLEDLWAFNEEVVVRAICECRIPVVSAVGHETDTTLSDYAADLRAPTPSAAAEHAVPETREIGRRVVTSFRRISKAVERQRIRRVEDALAPIKRYGFRRVRDRLGEARQRWGEAADRLAPAVAGLVDHRRLAFREAVDGLPDAPVARLAEVARRLERARSLPREAERRRERTRTRHAHLVERLEAASPLAILERGYAVVTGGDGRVVTDAGALATGERVRIRLAKGSAGAEVTETTTTEDGGR